MTKHKVLGIDLGTTYTCLAVYRNGKAEVVYNDNESSLTPSWVSFYEDTTYIGQSAKDLSTINPKNTLFSIKNIIGRDFNDPKLQEDIKNWPFEVVNRDGKPKVQVQFKGETKEFSPEEISALVLRNMLELAEKHLSEKIQEAVITVPAYFNNAQRQATRDAGIIAGINILRIVNEPTAAALAYGMKNNFNQEKLVLVYDLGGGTLDVSIVGIINDLFTVKSTSGDINLGGEYFDVKLLEYCLSIKDNGIGDNPRIISRLRKECQRAKERLSEQSSTTITIDGLPNDSFFQAEISRSKFNNICDKMFKKTLEPIVEALDGAKISKCKIDEIIMVGGSTRIPRIRNLVQEFFYGKPLNFSINPDEAIAYGAATQANSIKNGAYDKSTAIKIVDVIPLSIGIQEEDNIMSVIIPRNSQIPVKKIESYLTVEDYQEIIRFTVYEGERSTATDNHRLGEFDFKDPKRAKRGKLSYIATFAVDENGILDMAVEEKATQKRCQSKINLRSNTLPQKKIKLMILESIENSAKDLESIERVKSLRRLENFAYKLRRIAEEIELSIEDTQTLLSLSHIELDWIIKNGYDTKITYNKRYFTLTNISNPILEKIKKKVETMHKRFFNYYTNSI